ncbi:intracellular growth attenuator family protein [Edwardsiella ictaluri]|uniref:IgaA/UmoB family intracellular growth attenuator n=1 Tax=Edwardsiella ictaluri TaxID=67780 RepID=UPI0029B1EE0F|nr:intracellular growth attenuator family protein [Edwardsiella ictaluri]
MNVSIALLYLIPTAVIIGYIYWYTMKRASRLSASFPFVKTKQRKLNPEERQAIAAYLRGLDTASESADPMLTLRHQRLMPQGDRVYSVTHAITRYALAGDTPSQHRYFLDNQEIHLPACWEKYIADENSLELIKTATLPLVITINGHTLAESLHSQQLPTPTLGGAASIRRSEGDQVDLCGVRRETLAEYQLHQRSGARRAIPTALALILLGVALIVPPTLMPWLLALATPFLGWGLWCLYRKPSAGQCKEIHLLRGTPKRWGLFGESCGEQLSNISVGTLDLLYPPHWQPYIHPDIGHPTDIEIYQNRQVVRQGRFLSLSDEATQFPLQPWGRNALLGAAALIALLLLLTTQSLTIPLKISTAWLHGAQTLSATSVKQLTEMPLQVGDILDLRGSGTCHVPAFYQEGERYPFMPFDCSAIYWGTASPMAEPSSDTIDNAAALQSTVTRQLTAGDSDSKVSPALASAIQKSGMILLDDFVGIVLKTEALCAQKNECTRLKNSLVNLGNSKSWPALLKKAHGGGLEGVNVLMRPASARQLTNIVNSAVSSFYYRETHKAAQQLAVTPPGGVLISSDEGHQWVAHPQPSVSLYNYSPVDQWRELENLSRLLLNTPFRAHGVITEISTDANGTRHIMLHSQPAGLTLWRYLLMTPLLLALCVTLAVNATLFVRRLRGALARIPAIQHYYEQCINHKIIPFDLPPRP